jgi:hypothetical protein
VQGRHATSSANSEVNVKSIGHEPSETRKAVSSLILSAVEQAAASAVGGASGIPRREWRRRR